MAERKTLLIPSLLDDWFPLLQYAFTSEEWEPVLLTEDDPHLAELGLKYFHNELCYPVFLVAGQVLSALRSGRYDPARCGVLFGQAGDECRGSCGIRLLRRGLDRLGYGMDKYYGAEKGPALWAGKALALLLTCGYRPERGCDLFEEGMRRYCKHAQLRFLGSHAERHLGYDVPYMDAEKEARTRAFARELWDAVH